jgi:hypothetical protein
MLKQRRLIPFLSCPLQGELDYMKAVSVDLYPEAEHLRDLPPAPARGTPYVRERFKVLSLAAIIAQLLYAAPSHWVCIVSGD